MKPSRVILLAKSLPAALAMVAAALLAYVWGTGLPDGWAPLRLPTLGGDGAGDTGGASPLEKATLTTSGGTAADLPGAWPGFRGPNHDAVATDDTPLAESWAAGEPKPLWAVDVGDGYAGAAVLAGRVYLMDYDRDAQADALRCLSLADGKEIWRFSYPLSLKRNHGMSRTVPAVTAQHVVSLGPKCHVSCLDAVTGKLQWGIDLVREYGTAVPAWYAGQCPLIDGERVILAPSGSSLMIAVELATGKVLWKTPNPREWKMTHVSITPMEIAGRKTYVYCGHRGVAGIAADDGTLLWETPEWKISIATVATPVPVPDHRIFLSGGYEAGSMMLEIGEAAGKWTAKPVFRLDADTFGATQQTPVLYADHLYGVRPNGELVCLDLQGKVRWTSGMSHRFGLGPFMVANGKLFVMNDDGELTMAPATPDGFKPLAQAKVLDGHDAWGPLALAGGRLIVRDLTRMVCLDLRKK
ncbi:MAG: PQQ-like beta-propeller repeat protein [Verrucomicrobia bacterium]|nr:PQQ-like beta-propeller repeat protein [Verrucomicrobiota bacterium]